MDRGINVKPKFINILEENIQSFCDLGLGKGFFLDTTPKTLAM